VIQFKSRDAVIVNVAPCMNMRPIDRQCSCAVSQGRQLMMLIIVLWISHLVLAWTLWTLKEIKMKFINFKNGEMLRYIHE